ncbi:hypothetical protein [Achromobacter pestifer]|uniref:Uncharacterized protein n=1 Tax=Achromobacter pestifer TaxID=1353889 RepID=A0A6S6YVQ6_9BURK|nr:hypothetical protein [Achromobacter pestifer]CAB3648273.1 hypothetical protein LMG3431_02644 [Achromobacter pestifer]
MANNYFDATGVLVLDQVTPVISTLFGRFRLDPTYPGNGKAYIARISYYRVPQWNDVLVDLTALAARLDLPVPDMGDDEGEEDDSNEGGGDLSIEVVLDLLASHFGAEEDTDLQTLIKHHGFQDEADLEALFVIATAFDDGHRLIAVEFEGCWHCSKPRLFEFGGHGCFLSREVTLYGDSSQAIYLGQDLRKALLAGDLDEAAARLALEASGWLESIHDERTRESLRLRLTERLLANTAPHRSL